VIGTGDHEGWCILNPMSIDRIRRASISSAVRQTTDATRNKETGMQTLIQISKAHRVFGLAALSLLTMTVLAVAAGAARAQSPSSSQYPSQQIRIIVPSLPGGATDIYARMLGKVAGEILGQTFVVENKPGAASQIGTDFVAKAKPDGYTLLMGSLPLSTNPGLFPRLPYDVLTDLRGVIHVSGQGFIVSVPVNSPYKSFAELVEVARQREVPYATPGAGTVGHLAGQVMNVRYGTRFVHVAYRGSAAAINDVTGGQAFAADGAVMRLPMFYLEGDASAHVLLGR
jgi:tripartite-type tricarboxylate transporter receptor subunit TctC